MTLLRKVQSAPTLFDKFTIRARENRRAGKTNRRFFLPFPLAILAQHSLRGDKNASVSVGELLVNSWIFGIPLLQGVSHPSGIVGFLVPA